MPDNSTVFAFLALGMSAIAVVVSLLARRDSERSAGEAARARKISQSDLLRPHFEDMQYLWDVVFKKVGQEETKVKPGRKSIDNLKAILSHDQELVIALDRLLIMVGNTRNSLLEFYDTKDGKPPSEVPKDAADTFAIFERKRRKYLGIG